MAKEPVTPPRLIPNFAMDKPWTDPLSEAEADGLAMTSLLAGAPDTNRGVSTLLARFAGDYVQQLNNGRA